MMELPNYNRQLMHQLWALRKEGHFCDCTILVGDDPHHAHKVVLAASSMLFRSLLDGSDAVSIDPAVVSSQEFACLLDMIYTGKLPLGKHNVSRIIAAADTLQMFDVAVGFKNVLSTLVPSAQTPTAPPGSTPHTDASHHTQLELQPKEEEGRSDGTPPPPACKRTCPEHSSAPAESKPSEDDGPTAPADESTSGAPECSSELKQLLTNLSPAEWQQLSQAAGSDLDERDRQVVLTCCEETDRSSAAQQLMGKVDEGLLGEDALLRLLRSLQQKDPPSAAPAASLPQEEEEEEEEEEQEKTTKTTTTQEADGAAEDVKGEDKTEAEEDSSPSSSPSSRYSCRWCRKGFTYKCRKAAHEKRCPLSQQSELQCPDCPQKLANQRALQRHRLEAHRANTPSKKKVACDLCGRTFAHPSGMIYHKRTEHFEERPFSCSECGAKFGANSSLKNHMRLHTGEKPYVCKHCDMSFSVAAALAYHTKKKHSEGKMYVCQYCKAVFAQSIELTRHVRTHTGDRPYVCRECGKGYSQASGLTVHLHTFHNVAEPHDCQRCCLSFSSQEEHRQHVEDVHQKDFHTCPVCNKVFTSAALLDKHTPSHTGGKPFRCDLCNKSYQQVSGLWYHNRTNHPDVFASQTQQLKTLLQCDVCFKFFPSAGSLTEHRAAEHQGGAASSVHCPQCPAVLGGSEQLQEHVSSQHAHACPLCSLGCSSPLELQQHVLSQHVQEKTDASDMVVSEDGVVTLAAAGGPEDASQLAAAQQVLVALAGGGGGSSAEVVEVNMYDLLSSSVTFICEDKQDS